MMCACGEMPEELVRSSRPHRVMTVGPLLPPRIFRHLAAAAPVLPHAGTSPCPVLPVCTSGSTSNSASGERLGVRQHGL